MQEKTPLDQLTDTNPDDVASDCRQALALNPVHEQSVSLLATAYRHLGNVTAEQAALRRAAKIDPHGVLSQTARNRLLELRREL